MNVRTVPKGIRDDLRSNLTDPINRGAQWIHCSKIEETTKTPAIFIELAPSPRHDNYVGGSQEHYLNYHIHVMVRDKDEGFSVVGASGAKITNSGELRDNIIQGIIDRLETAKVSISGAMTIGLNDISGEFNVDERTKAITLGYEVEAGY